MEGNYQKRYRYFLYSAYQYKQRREIEKSMGKKYISGKVLCNGIWKEFTEISSNAENRTFSDSRIIAEGYLEDMKWQESKSIWGA